MKLCKTCAHWRAADRGHGPGAECVCPHDPVTYEVLDSDEQQRERFGFVVKKCHSPKVEFYERPCSHGAAVVDGSNYMASLLTAENFGCVLHEEITQMPKEE